MQSVLPTEEADAAEMPAEEADAAEVDVRLGLHSIAVISSVLILRSCEHDAGLLLRH